MLLAVERHGNALQRLPPAHVADDRTGRGFLLLAAELSLRPQRGADRMWVAVRHLGPVDAS
jgi:hypothetical protein